MTNGLFDKYVVKSEGCWQWLGGKDRYGYGVFRYQDRAQGAHRVSYKLNIGPIDDGLHVLHRCDNPECTNPEHLFLGTNADNVNDRISKGRRVGRNRSLNREDINQIKDLLACGLFSNRTIAKFWGINHNTIGRISTYHYKT